MTAPHFQRAVIYGVGLLGGSLGMAMLKRGIAGEVVGLGRSKERLEEARKREAITSISIDSVEALHGADALFLCLPPRQIRESLIDLAPRIPEKTFVTDVGSVKRAIVMEGEDRLGARAKFVGSHPMAGSEKSGIEAAREDLYEDAACFVTPTERTSDEALAVGIEFWRAVGCRPIIADPARHDRLLAATSHLPHLAAVSLVQSLYAGGDATLFFNAILGNGFRDTTRIAAGDPEMWEQIFNENAPALLQSVDGLIDILKSWRSALNGGGSRQEIRDRLSLASTRRRELNDAGKDGL